MTRSFKTKVAMLTLAAFSMIALANVATRHALAAKEAAATPAIGAAAPDFSLADQEGKQVALSDYKGKVVVLEWFNDECPFVKKVYKNGDMNDLAAKYKAQDVIWLAINSTEKKDVAHNKLKAGEMKIDRPILCDAEGKVGHLYDAKNTPQMFVIDKGGNVAYMGAFDSNRTDDASKAAGATNYVSKALDEVLAGKTVSEPETKPYGCSVHYAK